MSSSAKVRYPWQATRLVEALREALPLYRTYRHGPEGRVITTDTSPGQLISAAQGLGFGLDAISGNHPRAKRKKV